MNDGPPEIERHDPIFLFAYPTIAMASPPPLADAAPPRHPKLKFLFPLEWNRQDRVGEQSITMTTQVMDPHDPMWRLCYGPFRFVAIENADTNPQLAFVAIVESYDAYPNQLFDDEGEFDGDAKELRMHWSLRCSHISSDPAKLDRPATNDEIAEWNDHLTKDLPIHGPVPGLHGYFMPESDQLEELLADADAPADDVIGADG